MTPARRITAGPPMTPARQDHRGPVSHPRNSGSNYFAVVNGLDSPYDRRVLDLDTIDGESKTVARSHVLGHDRRSAGDAGLADRPGHNGGRDEGHRRVLEASVLSAGVADDVLDAQFD